MKIVSLLCLLLAGLAAVNSSAVKTLAVKPSAMKTSALKPVSLACEYQATQHSVEQANSYRSGHFKTHSNELVTEYQAEGVDTLAPRLSWQLESGLRAQKQTAYQILIASSDALLAQNRGDLWDTGKVISAQTRFVPVCGQAAAIGHAPRVEGASMERQ